MARRQAWRGRRGRRSWPSSGTTTEGTKQGAAEGLGEGRTETEAGDVLAQDSGDAGHRGGRGGAGSGRRPRLGSLAGGAEATRRRPQVREEAALVGGSRDLAGGAARARGSRSSLAAEGGSSSDEARGAALLERSGDRAAGAGGGRRKGEVEAHRRGRGRSRRGDRALGGSMRWVREREDRAMRGCAAHRERSTGGSRARVRGGRGWPWAGLALGQMGCGEAALFSLSLVFS